MMSAWAIVLVLVVGAGCAVFSVFFFLYNMYIFRCSTLLMFFIMSLIGLYLDSCLVCNNNNKIIINHNNVHSIHLHI